MITIEDKIVIDAPIAEVFDAERNIDLHVQTQAHRKELPVAGVTTGLIQLGEEVEWEAVHLGFRQRLRSRITVMESPTYFRDEMISGAFKSLCHDHRFVSLSDHQTEKSDILRLAAPWGVIGWLFERVFLGRYMANTIKEKNLTLKRILENTGEHPHPSPPAARAR